MTKLWITLTLLFLVVVGVCLFRIPVLHLTIAFYVVLISTAIAIVVAGVLSGSVFQAYLLHREQTQGNINDAKVISILGMRNRAMMGRRGQSYLSPTPELMSGEYRSVEIE